MEKISEAKKIQEIAHDAGVKPNKLAEAVATNSLPTSGKIVGWSVQTPVINGKKQPYLAIHCESGEMCSMNTLQAIVHIGTEVDKVTLKKVTKEGDFKGKFVVSGKSINPNLSGNQAEVIARILDKEFTSEIVSALVVPFGKNTESEATTRKTIEKKDYYKVTIL